MIAMLFINFVTLGLLGLTIYELTQFKKKTLRAMRMLEQRHSDLEFLVRVMKSKSSTPSGLGITTVNYSLTNLPKPLTLIKEEET